jgi:hypothetical protein
VTHNVRHLAAVEGGGHFGKGRRRLGILLNQYCCRGRRREGGHDPHSPRVAEQTASKNTSTSTIAPLEQLRLRRRARPKWRSRRIRLTPLSPVLEDPLDELRLLDARDHLERGCALEILDPRA